MQGQVYKIHSDFYYVKNYPTNDEKIYVCKLREILKKQKTEIVVGDIVEINVSCNRIENLIQRKNFIPRPKSANIDLALVVCPLKEPELDFIQLNRYLTFLKFHNIPCAICFNKEDLVENLEEIKINIKNIYENLSYKTFFISAKNRLDLDDLRNHIKNKTIVLCGISGAGKSTLINSLNPESNMRTQKVSSKTQKGCHTTRHCEIIDFKDFKIMDTPGFSCLKFDFLLPDKLISLFEDISRYNIGCKYANCLHDVKTNGICNVYDNLDKIEKTRYESYLCFLEEAISYKKKISKRSTKEENFTKNTGSKIVAKISKRKRNSARNTTNQKIKDI